MDKLELENRQLKTLSTSYQDQVEEANAKIKQLQDSMNDTASDEMASLLRDLNEATSLRVSDGVDRPNMSSKSHDKSQNSSNFPLSLLLDVVCHFIEFLVGSHKRNSRQPFNKHNLFHDDGGNSRILYDLC